VGVAPPAHSDLEAADDQVDAGSIHAASSRGSRLPFSVVDLAQFAVLVTKAGSATATNWKSPASTSSAQATRFHRRLGSSVDQRPRPCIPPGVSAGGTCCDTPQWPGGYSAEPLCLPQFRSRCADVP
jgi:hypothetical protein